MTEIGRMFAFAVSLIVAIHGFGANVERQSIAGTPFEFDANGDQRAGALACWGRDHIVMFYSPGLTAEGEVHEYRHGLDCADDGLLNGSNCWPRPATYEEALLMVYRERPGVLSSAAVWYAWAGTMGPVPVQTADAEWCAVMSTLMLR